MKKRLGIGFLVIVSATMLVACGNKGDKKTEVATEATTEASTEKKTEEATETPTEKTTEAITSKTSTEKQTESDPIVSYREGLEEDYIAMIEKSLISTGNNARLKKAIEKAQNGEEVLIAAIGGSITEGALATPNTNCYAYQSYEAFKKAFGKGDGENVTFINAGMSGTPSTLGMIRYKRDVLDEAEVMPDLVFVEFAVNDGDDPTNGDAYESLVRNILTAENNPAVVLIFSVFQSKWNLQDRLIPIGEYYDLPMVSIKNALIPEIEAGNVTNDQFFGDTLHPNNWGHKMMVHCVTNLFEAIYAEETKEDVEIPAKAKIGNSFEGIKMIDANSDMEIEVGSFLETDKSIGTLQYNNEKKTFPDNWQHKAGSESFKLTLNAKNLCMVYKKSNSASYGKAEVYVDGELVKTINGKDNGGWNNPFTVVLFSQDEASEHTIEIKMAEGDEEKMFTIMALGYTE